MCFISDTILWFRFIVEDRINAYRGTGGVRIEDDIIINANGAELMSIVPRLYQLSKNQIDQWSFRTVEEIEGWMAGDDSFMAHWK